MNAPCFPHGIGAPEATRVGGLNTDIQRIVVHFDLHHGNAFRHVATQTFRAFCRCIRRIVVRIDRCRNRTMSLCWKAEVDDPHARAMKVPSGFSRA